MDDIFYNLPPFFYVTTTPLLAAYCLIVSSFLSWSSRRKSSFSKVSIAFLLSLAKVKGNLKNTTSYRIKVLHPIFHHPHIYKIM